MAKTPSDTERRAVPAAAAFYAALAPTLRDVARDLGYALAVHGSMATDLDLVAVPWAEGAAPPDKLAEAIGAAVGCSASEPSVKPHGRLAWTISLEAPAFWSIRSAGVERPLAKVWIDLSVMQSVEAAQAEARAEERQRIAKWLERWADADTEADHAMRFAASELLSGGDP